LTFIRDVEPLKGNTKKEFARYPEAIAKSEAVGDGLMEVLVSYNSAGVRIISFGPVRWESASSPSRIVQPLIRIFSAWEHIFCTCGAG